MGVGVSTPVKSRLSSVGYMEGRCGSLAAGNRDDRSARLRRWSPLFFTLMTAFLDLTAAGKGIQEPPLTGLYRAISNHRAFILPTTQPDPLLILFWSVSRILGNALSSASLIS